MGSQQPKEKNTANFRPRQLPLSLSSDYRTLGKLRNVTNPQHAIFVFAAIIIFIIKSYRHWAKGWKCLETEASQVNSPHLLGRTSRSRLDSHRRQQAEPERHPGVGWKRRYKQRHDTRE